MGLSSVCSVLLLFSMVSLYHASHLICDEGYYCPVRANCSGNNTNCEEGICPDGINEPSIANLTAKRCDEEPIVLNFTKSSFSVAEGNGPSMPVLTLSRALDCCTISVRVLVQNNTAFGGEDFERLLPGDYATVIFPAGQTRKPFNVMIIDDNMHERSETFRVTINEISVPHGVVLGSPRSSVVTIIDNDPPRVKFESEEYSVGEGDGVAVVKMILSNPSHLEFSIRVYSIHETATECDYGNGTYDVVFPPNNTTASFTVNITDDNVNEENETFKLAIDTRALPSQVTVNGGRSIIVTIVDNEEVTRVGFDQRMYRVHEDEEYIAPILMLDKPAKCCIIIRAMLKNSTALGRNVDFGPSKIYNYTFYAGDSEASPDENITIVDDLDFEEKENFVISIIDVSLPYGYEKNENATPTICIIDNDNGIEFVQTNYTVYEDTADGHVTLTLRMFRPAMMNVSVQLITVSTSATEHADYDGGPVRVIIPEGEQEVNVSINITNDGEQEIDEKFNVIITAVGLPGGITPKQGADLTEITIVNDDYDCIFNESTYTIDEGDAVTLQLTLTTALYKDVEIHLAYINKDTTNDTDYSYSTRRAFFLNNTQDNVPIRISTKIDGILESNEIIEVIAVLPEERGDCRAQVIIVDDNTCEFSSETDEVIEGGEVKLNLTFTKKLSEDVDIEIQYSGINNLASDIMDPPESVSLVAGETYVLIDIKTLMDLILENNESLTITAYPPSDDRRHCSTVLTIVDDNNLRVSPSDVAVHEGTNVRLIFTLDRPLLTTFSMQVPWSYQYKVYKDEDRKTFITNYIRFSHNRREVEVEVKVIDDSVLEPNETFVVTASPPADPEGSRNATATITIIDNDALTVEFDKDDYTIEKDQIELEQIVLRLSGTASFNIHFLLREIIGTAIGAEHDPDAMIIDYEEYNKTVTIYEGDIDYKLLIDTKDDDIVEPPIKYFKIQIDETSLPDGVSVGAIGTAQINIMDDDVSYVLLGYNELELSKGLYTSTRVTITLMSGNTYERTIPTGGTTLDYPEGSKFHGIKEVHLYVSESLKDRVLIRESDKEFVKITWEP